MSNSPPRLVTYTSVPVNALIIGLLIILLTTQPAFSQGEKPQTEADFHKPMTFQAYTQHSGSSAIYYTLAIGVITSSTPTEFLKYQKRMRDEAPDEVWFHSPGGNLGAALELGKIIRRLGLTTRTGGAFERWPGGEDYYTVESAKCYSACAWAFLGGKVRILRKDNAYGVHQFYNTKGVGSESDAQVTTAQLSMYLEQMSVDRKLLDIASLTTANKVTTLTIDETQELNVDNSQQSIGKWEIKASEKTGRVVGVLTQKLMRTDDTASFMVMADTSAEFLNLVVIYSTAENSRPMENLQSIFDEMGGQPRIYPGTDYVPPRNSVVPITIRKRWHHTKNRSFQIWIRISKASLRNLCRYEFFMFNPSLPNCCIDAAPHIAVPTKGLNAIIAAINSQGALK